jgi:hypothetical protein
MALKLKESIFRKPDDEDGNRRNMPTIPLAALEEHRRLPAVRERRERVRARMKAKDSS